MSIPEITTTITDGALGIVPEAIDGITAKIGTCSSGTVGTLYAFSDIKTLVATLGYGPLVEAVAHQLAVSGGPVYCVKATGATAGSCSAVTPSNGGGPVVTVSVATAFDTYQAIVKITLGGARATATFKYSLDGGDNYSADIATAATYAIPNSGITIAFATGSDYVLNDTYAFTSAAPLYDSSALSVAITALMADPREWRFVHFVGKAVSAAASAAFCATIDTAMTAAATAYRYVRAIVDASDDTDANQISGFAALSTGRVAVAPGLIELVSSVSGRIYKRPAAWVVAARAAKVPVHEDLGRVKSGSLPGVVSMYRDERTAASGLDAQRFTTLRSIIGLGGFYVTSGRTLASVTSDYQLLQNGFVIDKACRYARIALLRYLNDTITVNATTGYILEEDAQAIEADVTSQLNAALISTGNASAIQVKVSRTENMLSTQTLPVTIRVIPRSYSRFITEEIGLYNPALQPVAA